MTAIETDSRFLLLAVLAEIELFAELPDDLAELPDPFIGAMIGKGVPFVPAHWAGRALPPARRMAFSRAARRLADRGLMWRITDIRRDRVRYLIPTPAGIRNALVLAKSADRSAVVEGLNRTRWGPAIVRALQGDERSRR